MGGAGRGEARARGLRPVDAREGGAPVEPRRRKRLELGTLPKGSGRRAEGGLRSSLARPPRCPRRGRPARSGAGRGPGRFWDAPRECPEPRKRRPRKGAPRYHEGLGTQAGVATCRGGSFTCGRRAETAGPGGGRAPSPASGRPSSSRAGRRGARAPTPLTPRFLVRSPPAAALGTPGAFRGTGWVTGRPRGVVPPSPESEESLLC